MSDSFTFNKLYDGKAVFLNYWIPGEPLASMVKKHYNMTILPGRNEELSSTSESGFNIGINRLLEITESNDKNVTNAEKLEAAVRVAEFITSKDFHKMLCAKGEVIPAMSSLFEDEDVCNAIDCDLLKNMQPIPENIYEKSGGIYNRYDYELKFRNFASDYLFNKDVSLEDTLRKIEDITKIYYVPLNFSLGIVMIILIIVVSFLMLISLIFLFFENYQPFFKFLSMDSWFILVLGIIITLSSNLMSFGEITVTKCHLRLGLLEIGITVFLSIILYELMINLPSEIKFIQWVKKHKYLFLLFLYSIDILLIGITILYPYNIKTVIVEDGHNYQTCKMENIYGKLITIIISSEKLIFVLLISFLIFIEWNKKNIFYEIRLVMFAIYSDILLLSLTFIVNYIDFKNYYIKFILQQCILLFIYISSYTCLYGFKLLLALIGKKDLKISFINKINENFINSTDLKTKKTVNESFANYKIEKSVEESDANITVINGTEFNDDSNNNPQKKSLYSKIITYHYSSFSSIESDNAGNN